MKQMSVTFEPGKSKPSPVRLATWRWVFTILLSGSFVQATELGEKTKESLATAASTGTVAPKSPWNRIVMVGASASAGFLQEEPLGGPKTDKYRLRHYLDAALLVPHKPVRSLANTLFFIQPEVEGKRQIELALEANPSLVLGLDFLFWFCYGDGRTDQERLQRFENGLKLLEPLRCPMIIGDIPDATCALNSMLTQEEIPSAHAMSAANRRLRQWATAHLNVMLLPLSKFMSAVVANQAISVHDHLLPQGKTAVLLQNDRLHPSPQGCAVLALMALEAFQSTRPSLSTTDVCWDPTEVFRLGYGDLRKSPNPSDKQS